MIPHPYEIPSTVRSRAARLAEAARTYYTARTGGARFRAWQEMQDQEEPMRTVADQKPTFDREALLANLLEESADAIRDYAPGMSLLLRRIDEALEERRKNSEAMEAIHDR